MAFIYEFNIAGAKLMWRDICNSINGNNKLIREYHNINRQLLNAGGCAKSKNRKQKLMRAYRELSESKIIPLGGNRFELAGYNAGMATRAQNQAKVIMGRKMLERFELTK